MDTISVLSSLSCLLRIFLCCEVCRVSYFYLLFFKQKQVF